MTGGSVVPVKYVLSQSQHWGFYRKSGLRMEVTLPAQQEGHCPRKVPLTPSRC